MMPYTPEQIEQAMEPFRSQGILVRSDRHTPVPPHGLILISALEAAEKERDELLEALNKGSGAIDVGRIFSDRNAQHNRVETLTAYAAKLEKAGDALKEELFYLLNRKGYPVDSVEEITNWDAARKEKP